MKVYLCIEFGDRFYIEAENLKDAKAKASIYGAEVIKEVPSEYFTTVHPNNVNV